MISKDSLHSWVDAYLEHVEEVGIDKHVDQDPEKGEEGYKFVAVDHFQKTFNLSAPDLKAMLDEAILDGNLVAGVQYLPKRMLLRFAEEYEKETREILAGLFDESHSAFDRLDESFNGFEGLIAARNKKNGRNDKSYIGLRFLSLLLSFHAPNSYNAIKPSNWRVFCSYVDPDFKIPKKSSPGEQYKIYEQYIDSLRELIRSMPEIDNIRKRLTSGLDFEDREYRWMAQNVIYTGSRKLEPAEEPIAEEERKEAEPSEEGADELETADDFKSETALEVHIARNWKVIPYFFGFELQKGSAPHGGQYPANGKSIDLLAYSASRKIWLVIELKTKKNPDTYKTVGQLQTYMGFVKSNLAKEGEEVRGLIVTGLYNADIESAISVAPNIAWLVYSVRLQYVDFKLHEPLADEKGFDDLFTK